MGHAHLISLWTRFVSIVRSVVNQNAVISSFHDATMYLQITEALLGNNIGFFFFNLPLKSIALGFDVQNLAPCQLKHRQVKLPRHDIQYAYKIVSLSPPIVTKVKSIVHRKKGTFSSNNAVFGYRRFCRIAVKWNSLSRKKFVVRGAWKNNRCAAIVF